MIRARVDLAGFLMTPDAAFGFERRGTPEAVAELGRREGFEVVGIPPFTLDGRAVRSSDIRAAIAAGDLATARQLLGRDVTVAGMAEVDGQDALLTFEMPVALPPPGTYQATVSNEPCELQVADDGEVRLRPASVVGSGDALTEVRLRGS